MESHVWIFFSFEEPGEAFHSPRGQGGKVAICKQGLFATIFDDGADLLQSDHKEGTCIYPLVN